MFSSSRLINSIIILEQYANYQSVVSAKSHEFLSILWREYRKAYKSEKDLEKKLKRGIGKIKVDEQINQHNDCGICLDRPNYNDLVTTSCGHNFCKGCYKKWVIEKTMIKDIENDEENLEGVTCPMCREYDPTLTYYKQKKKQVVKNKKENKNLSKSIKKKQLSNINLEKITNIELSNKKLKKKFNIKSIKSIKSDENNHMNNIKKNIKKNIKNSINSDRKNKYEI